VQYAGRRDVESSAGVLTAPKKKDCKLMIAKCKLQIESTDGATGTPEGAESGSGFAKPQASAGCDGDESRRNFEVSARKTATTARGVQLWPMIRPLAQLATEWSRCESSGGPTLLKQVSLCGPWLTRCVWSSGLWQQRGRANAGRRFCVGGILTATVSRGWNNHRQSTGGTAVELVRVERRELRVRVTD
jgi:hypothetical protein